MPISASRFSTAGVRAAWAIALDSCSMIA